MLILTISPFVCIDRLLYIFCCIQVLYILYFVLISRTRNRRIYKQTDRKNKFLILIPAYKEDRVILDTVISAKMQNYPDDKFDVVVVSDNMQENTVDKIKNLCDRVIEINISPGSKAIAINYALSEINEPYDGIVIIDADNIINRDFLADINSHWSSTKINIIQAHRCAKNLDTDIAFLDAVSEEINNTIFRDGHTKSGISSALIGSGMILDYNWFKQITHKLITSTEDKELELLILKGRLHIEYLNDIIIEDEKIRDTKGFRKQRGRWLSGNRLWIKNFKLLLKAIIMLNIPLAYKLIQWMMLPRVVLLGLISIISIIFSFISIDATIKWYILLVVYIVALVGAIPKKLISIRLIKVVVKLPILFLIMVINLLKPTRKTFTHTQHL
ncbi:MAG: glycosyltransferase family 2 protein [Muribaculaceae bacterium]|nr:glycosyltransferase family 2 protein [Muribaculaceae bacterium]